MNFLQVVTVVSTLWLAALWLAWVPPTTERSRNAVIGLVSAVLIQLLVLALFLEVVV